MKFKLVIEDGRTVICLEPQNDGEQQMLLAIRPFQADDIDDVTALVEGSYTSDRPPYKKITQLRIIVRG